MSIDAAAVSLLPSTVGRALPTRPQLIPVLPNMRFGPPPFTQDRPILTPMERSSSRADHIRAKHSMFVSPTTLDRRTSSSCSPGNGRWSCPNSSSPSREGRPTSSSSPNSRRCYARDCLRRPRRRVPGCLRVEQIPASLVRWEMPCSWRDPSDPGVWSVSA
uniref:Uncharacterized protein n=1 Tax=Cacopsylla melanoneura TaxID=428564 RepID=A0A8D8PN00_9HEMI